MKTLLVMTAFASLSLAACQLKVAKGDIDESPNGPSWLHADCGEGGDDAGGDEGGASEGGEGGADGGCTDDGDCAEGEICRDDQSCATPTCLEIEDELACVERSDCEPVYAGVDCSCGPDCTCQAGEPGCICESFEFFKCDEALAE